MNNGLIRPDKVGFWWKLDPFKGWFLGQTKIIYFEYGNQDDGENILSYSEGGCYTRCDMINSNRDEGTRFFLADPPKIPKSL